MAFGFGFNKQKVLSAAEKFVQQGKLQNAIAEYDKILQHDAKDLTVNNTIGDLYARLGDTAKAIECFKSVGDAYAAQGFTVKGIAMYKKIVKLQPSVDGSLKLAELYTQQGLFNDARSQYLQVAEDFLKNGELQQASRLFLKVLEMDPENVPMRVKLAEVYVRLDKKKEAWEIFSAVAESLRSRGSLAAADDILTRMLALEPGNSYVLLLRGKSALQSGDPKSAIAYFEKAADIDSHPEGLRDLLRGYLQVGNLTKASPTAEKLLTVHNDAEGLFLLAEGCARLGQFHQALDVYTRHADRLLATDSTKLLASLHTMIARVREDSGALDALLLLLNKAGESTHVAEVTELLAHALVEDGNLARARDLYQTLAVAEPQNPLHMQNYQQVAERMTQGAPVAGITAEEGTLIIEELEATAPPVDQSYPDAVAIAVNSAITDADLFLSYNLPEKALAPLLGVLPQAPSDARLNQRLAALHTRFQRFTEAAVCCRTLESVYHDAGCPEESRRYAELAARYEKNAEAAAATYGLPAPESSTSESKPSALSAAASASPSPAVSALPALAPPAVAPAAAFWPAARSADRAAPWPLAAPANVEATDLTAAWEESLSNSKDGQQSGGHMDDRSGVDAHGDPKPACQLTDGVGTDAASNPEIAETVEEIHFYLEHFMTDQAQVALEKLETLVSDPLILDPLRAALASAKERPEEPEAEIAEINADEPAEFEIPTAISSEPEISTAPDLIAGYHHETAEITDNPLPSGKEAAAAPAIEPKPQSAPCEAEKSAPETASELPALVAELEASLGDSFPAMPPAQPTTTDSPVARALTGWPVAPLPQFAAGTKTHDFGPGRSETETAPWKSAEPPVETMPAAVEPVASDSPATPAAVANPSPDSPKISYGPVPERPLGAAAEGAAPSGSVDLSEMFGALKQELEAEPVPGGDDPETHYNLGMAFREMGLLDEAIAEFQNVGAAIDRGKAFPHIVQTYTWLAQCFLDKGVPQAAIRWYEKALHLPGLDEQGRLAINYELGSACESAQDRPAALRHFTDVYSANIDYRDVAERIQALKS